MPHKPKANNFFLFAGIGVIGIIAIVALILSIVNPGVNNNVSPSTLEVRVNQQALSHLFTTLEFLCFGTEGDILPPENIPVRAREMCDCINERLPAPFKGLPGGNDPTLQECLCEVINDRCGPPNAIPQNGVCSPGFRNVCPN